MDKIRKLKNLTLKKFEQITGIRFINRAIVIFWGCSPSSFLSGTFVTMTSGITEAELDLLEAEVLWSTSIFQGFSVAWGDSGRLVPEIYYQENYFPLK